MQAAAPRRKVTNQPLKMASNKAFQVSCKPQYKRATARNPLVSLNKGKAVTERPFSKQGPQTSPQQMASNSMSQENIYEVCRRSSQGPKLDDGEVCLSPEGMVNKYENKDFIKTLNETLSPVGTPERFKKLMPHIYHESPLSAAMKPAASPEDPDGGVTGAPVLSIKEALVLIDSDLSHMNSTLQDTSQSDSFSDSLESKSDSRGCKADEHFLKALPDIPHQPEAFEQRLTFFVTKKVASKVAGSEPIIKAPFTSATVTKVKAPVEANGLSGRKIRKSKRRLLEKTLELSDGSSDSGPGTPTLPVIDGESKACDDAQHPEDLRLGPPPTISPVASPLSVDPVHVSFSLTSSHPVDTSIPSSSPVITSSPLHFKLLSITTKSSPPAPAPPAPPVQEDLFLVHMAVRSKKRKSEEFLKSDGQIADAVKTEPVKRTRMVPIKPEPCALLRERRSTPQRQQWRAAGEWTWCLMYVDVGIKSFHL